MAYAPSKEETELMVQNSTRHLLLANCVSRLSVRMHAYRITIERGAAASMRAKIRKQTYVMPEKYNILAAAI